MEGIHITALPQLSTLFYTLKTDVFHGAPRIQTWNAVTSVCPSVNKGEMNKDRTVELDGRSMGFG